MYKLKTKLSHFRFNSIIRREIYTVEWYKYNPDTDKMEGLTHNELVLFTNFAAANSMNFGGEKNYAIAENDASLVDTVDAFPIGLNGIPSYYILRSSPELSKDGSLFSAMDIVLQNGLSDHHKYNLPFAVVGRRIDIE
ncbi:hypothetical protein [Dinghuibacter silviterrae]|nr:hypothetical protein [Dinghuibacter silviterrae]